MFSADVGSVGDCSLQCWPSGSANVTRPMTSMSTTSVPQRVDKRLSYSAGVVSCRLMIVLIHDVVQRHQGLNECIRGSKETIQG